MQTKIIITALAVLAPTFAHAGEACRSAKDFVNAAQAFYGDNPERKNIITPIFSLSMKGINGAADPTAILYRHENTEAILPVEGGALIGIEAAAKWSKDGEMCRMIDGELAPKTEGDSTEASMSFSFPYKRTDGLFPIAEIREGAKDGSKVMNALAPGGLGFAVPSLKAIVIQPEEGAELPPRFVFSRNGKAVQVETTKYAADTFIHLKDIKTAKADMLKIEGPYRLNATFKFDPETLAKAEEKRIAELNAPQD